MERVGEKMMSEKKTDQAMRLMEALNGVDPELLSRSEKKKKIIPFQYYARIAAACLAVCVAGGLMFVTVRYGSGMKQEAATNNSANSAAIGGNGMKNGAADQGNHADGGQAEMAAFEEEMEDEQKTEACEQSHNVAEQAECADSATSNIDWNGVQGATAATDLNKEYKAAFRVEDILTKLGLRSADKATTVELKTMSVAITLGEDTFTCDTEALREVYDYLGTLELEEEDDEAAQFHADIVLARLDGEGRGIEKIAIDGNYVKMEGSENIFRIISEDYDHEKLYADLMRIVREEKE